MPLIDSLRAEARLAPVSGIEAVMNYGRGRPGLIPLWAGEGDLPTPDFINAAADARPCRRRDLLHLAGRHSGAAPGARPLPPAAFRPRLLAPTSSSSPIGGMQAIQLALAATAGAGDEAIYLTPAWPNFAAAAGGRRRARRSPCRCDQGDNGWVCDVERIEAAVTPRTQAIFVNTPSNPTGWTADRETLQAILDLARRHGLWIIADEIYALFHFGGSRAASFIDIMEPEDRILFVNTFSKNWAMTGWRIGWLRAHPVARPHVREPDPVFDLRRRAVPAARRHRRARRGR